MEKLLKQFTCIALTYLQLPIEDVWNRYINTLSTENVKIVSDHIPLFFETAEAARCAPPDIQNTLKKRN